MKIKSEAHSPQLAAGLVSESKVSNLPYGDPPRHAKGCFKNSLRTGKYTALIGMALFLTLAIVSNLRAAEQPAATAAAEMLRLGERMYRQGILPSGEPMTAMVSGDVPVSGAAFTCISCHLRSGLGSIEGTVITPPTTGKILYAPRLYYKPGFEMVENVRRYSRSLPTRPAYTDESLAAAIAGGIDPNGRKMDQAMPLYDLNERDMAILINYLKSLSTEFSPGISEDGIRFATVITDGVSQKDVDAMLAPINYYMDRKNDTANLLKTKPNLARMAIRMMGPDLAAKHFTLTQWHLQGPPETWRTQLEDYYRLEPVFALLGGISSGEWQPIHKFCEDMHLPCLFPDTDFPVRSEKDWYTLYFSKGIYQEGEAAARYLNHHGDSGADTRILQIVRETPRGQALADGFRETWVALGHEPPPTIHLKPVEPWSAADMRQKLEHDKPVTLLLWDDGPGALPILEALATEKNRPGMVFVSNTYMGASISKIKEPARTFTYISYPYRMPQEDARYDTLLKPIAKNLDLSGDGRKVFEQAYSVGDMMSRALFNMWGEYYRDYFLDIIGMMGDQDLPLYERLSFGPGQRYAAKGCFIVQLGPGSDPVLIKKSEWVIN